MVEISFLNGELCFAGLWLLLRLFVWIRNGGVDWKREARLLLMYVNLAVILRMVFFPMERIDGRVQPLLFGASRVRPFRVNLKPFVYLTVYNSKKKMLLNVLGNVGMFIPSGIILPILYKKLDSFRRVTAAGFLISLCIELLQLPFYVRTTDIDDLILNTLGVMIGYGIYKSVKTAGGTP